MEAELLLFYVYFYYFKGFLFVCFTVYCFHVLKISRLTLQYITEKNRP